MPERDDHRTATRPAAGSCAPARRGRSAAAGAASAPRRKGSRGQGLLPLDYMLEVLRDPEAAPGDKRWAAEKAAPYLHARLSTVDHRGEVALRHEDLLDALEGEPG